jgi:hypothetical protein
MMMMMMMMMMQEQQGMYAPTECVYDVTHGQHLRTLLHAHPEPINPHLDINGTGLHEVMIGPVYYRLKSSMDSAELACIYTPTGKGTYTMSPERVRYLYSRFKHTEAHHNKIFEKLKAKPFPGELFNMVTRCRNETTTASGWSLPPPVYQAICKHTTAKTERFANPLDSHASSERCWSAHKRDQLFGFKYDAFKCKWTGPSTATPPSEPEVVLKTLTHTIRSARTANQCPTMATLVIPAWSETQKCGYNNLINANTDVCKIRLKVPAHHFKVHAPPSQPLNLCGARGRWH